MLCNTFDFNKKRETFEGGRERGKKGDQKTGTIILLCLGIPLFLGWEGQKVGDVYNSLLIFKHS